MILEGIKMIAFILLFCIGILLWLFSAVIAWEFIEWIDRKKRK